MPDYIWIPVQDKLPEESGWYMVTADAPGLERLVTEEYYSTIYGWSGTFNISAWIPLPDPYDPKGVIDDEES